MSENAPATPAAEGTASPLIPLCSTTVRIAVPIEPPTRWSTFSCGVASLICSGRSTAYAAVIDGIIVRPMPNPRTTIAAEISR